MKSDLIRIFQTLEHDCGYYPDRRARNLVIDPVARGLPRIYNLALERGFRRSGGHVYRPHCRNCRACVAVRIPVARFRLDRSQRRCLRRNADIDLQLVEARRTDENFALYRRYLDARHPGGGMDDPLPEDFDRFLSCGWSPTRFLEMRLHGRLAGIAAVDLTPNGVSAVYTFFDPALADRSLGTFAILSEVELARQEGLGHLYLGYWIAGHPKMQYKTRFRPLEALIGNGWTELRDPPTP